MRSERAHQLRNVIKRMYCSQLLAFQGFVSYERFQKQLDVPSVEQKKAPLRLRVPAIPGGIRIPHLHFRGDVYLLNEKQWKDFSIKVIKDFQAKLSRVNTVSFEQEMEISEAVDSLA